MFTPEFRIFQKLKTIVWRKSHINSLLKSVFLFHNAGSLPTSLIWFFPLYPLKIYTDLYEAAKRVTFIKISHVPPHLQVVLVNETQLSLICYFYALPWNKLDILYAMWNVIF